MSAPQSATITVTDETFASLVLASDKPVLVDYWATWCGPCRMLAPVLEEIAAEHAERLTVAKVDIQASPVTARDQRVMAVPTIILYRDGEQVAVSVGAHPKARLLAMLESHLQVS